MPSPPLAATFQVASRLGARLVGTLVVGLDLTHDARLDRHITDRRTFIQRRARRARQLGLRMCALHRCEVSVHGAAPRGPAVIVSNHLNWLDPMVFSSTLPLTGLSKAEMAAWPVVGPCGRAVGSIFVERGDPWSGMLALRSALRALEADVPVLNFCEGTTSAGDVVRPFRAGIFGLARLAGVPVVPAALRYAPADTCWPSEEVLSRNYLRVARHPRWTAQVHYGEALAFAPGTPDAERAELARAAVRRLAGLDPAG